MLDNERVAEIAEQAARAQIGDDALTRVISTTALDSLGNDALHITIVLNPGGVAKLSGGVAIDLLLSVNDDLQKAGENRSATLEYATEQELNETDDEDA